MNQANRHYAPLASAATRSNVLWMWLWLLVFCCCAGFCVQQMVYVKPVHSNLLELLPRDERNPALHDLSQVLASRFQDKLLVLVNSDNAEQGLAQARDLQARLLASAHLTADNPAQALQQELIKLYRPFSQQLLSAERRQWLQHHTPEELADQTYRALFNPVNLPRPYTFGEDPFNLGGHWLASLAPRLNIQEYQGFPLITDEHTGQSHQWLLVSAQLKDSPFAVAVQNDVITAIQDFRRAWPQAELVTSGMIFHAAAGTEQATREINTVGLGSTLGIVALVLLVFRRPTPLLAVLLTMGSAYVLALAVTLLVFGRIHIITLAFGSTLLGVAGDYVLHFLMGSQRDGGGVAARHDLRYAMAIGAITGMAAYLLQFTTPFPGLQQMAIFCAAGILGAWLTVLALAPLYRATPASRRPPLVAADIFYRFGKGFYRRFWNHPRLVGMVLVFMAGLALWGIGRGGVNDAVVNLNTSPSALLAAEQRVQQIMQQPSVSRFFFIEGNSLEQLLQRTEALNAVLAGLADPALQWQSLQQYLPSAAQQLQDRQLVEAKLYGAEGALGRLCLRLGNSCVNPPVNPQPLILDALDKRFAAFLPPVMQGREGWRTLVTITGNRPDAELAALVEPLAGVSLVNQTNDLSQLLGRYRANVSEVLAVTLILLAAGLALRYRRRSWRLLVPLCVAMLFALGAAAVDGITLFHVMALLLVIGIGLDTAVFYSEGGFNAESWLASSLACGTSILAFGLLSLSAVPVLHQFGLIILVGILSCWLLTPLFFRPSVTPDRIIIKGNLS